VDVNGLNRNLVKRDVVNADWVNGVFSLLAALCANTGDFKNGTANGPSATHVCNCRKRGAKALSKGRRARPNLKGVCVNVVELHVQLRFWL
jgi:hypothetical protein